MRAAGWTVALLFAGALSCAFLAAWLLGGAFAELREWRRARRRRQLLEDLGDLIHFAHAHGGPHGHADVDG